MRGIDPPSTTVTSVKASVISIFTSGAYVFHAAYAVMPCFTLFLRSSGVLVVTSCVTSQRYVSSFTTPTGTIVVHFATCLLATCHRPGPHVYPASQGPEHLASFKPVLSPYRPEGHIVPVCSCYPLGKSDPRRTNRHSLGLLIRMKHHTSQPDKANIFSNHDLCIYHVHKRSHSCYSHQREKRTNKIQ